MATIDTIKKTPEPYIELYVIKDETGKVQAVTYTLEFAKGIMKTYGYTEIGTALLDPEAMDNLLDDVFSWGKHLSGMRVENEQTAIDGENND